MSRRLGDCRNELEPRLGQPRCFGPRRSRYLIVIVVAIDSSSYGSISELWQGDLTPANMIAYSRPSGFFGGIALEGGALLQRRTENAVLHHVANSLNHYFCCV